MNRSWQHHVRRSAFVGMLVVVLFMVVAHTIVCLVS